MEDEHTRDEVREMAIDIMATSTTELTHPIRLARSVCFARPSLKMRLASLGAGEARARRGDVEHAPFDCA